MSKSGKSTGIFQRGAARMNARDAETNRTYAEKAGKGSTGLFKRGIAREIERTGTPNILPPRFTKIK